ncbi:MULTISPECIES: ribosome recycling factor family protein [Thalassotalea]|uniref:Ribosome recycling factor family protein n=1 Tax=Thalassotalea castellviae TaxID=3075612 RepID=A0ABU2ZY04_9GAMM|nr:ribosome recycling factor family protein [Thalassotalea sp. W431]MDT0602435.1 ribosome recycling factor family protein [Thalassotalea sp. W431]
MKRYPHQTKTTTITLPSFLRRVMKAYAIKAIIREAGCELARIGRSRNWRLTATPEEIHQVISLIESQGEDSWLWVAKKLKQDGQQFSHRLLVDIAKKNTGITVNELMAKTDCTVIQARKVIDEIEWSDE